MVEKYTINSLVLLWKFMEYKTLYYKNIMTKPWFLKNDSKNMIIKSDF